MPEASSRGVRIGESLEKGGAGRSARVQNPRHTHGKFSKAKAAQVLRLVRCCGYWDQIRYLGRPGAAVCRVHDQSPHGGRVELLSAHKKGCAATASRGV